MRRWRLRGAFVGLLLCAVGQPLAVAQSGNTDFELAQVAAQDGRYRDVIEILSRLLLDPELDVAGQVVAYSNRGIAYSLLNAYGLAKQDLEEAHRLDPDHLLTLNHLGILAAQVDENPEIAVSYFGQAAEAGFPPSQVALAGLLRDGKGVAKDEARAFALYQQAADANYTLAFSELGEMLMQGLGTPRNTAKAVVWFKLAAAVGVVEANFQLGLAYDVGTGVGVDATVAADQFQIAALQGHAGAQNALGYMYRRGRGVAQDYVKAAQWYRLAADQGEVEAQNRLAWLLASCPVAAVCHGEAAVALAQQALQQAQLPTYLDSLAAGYARMGEFDAAVSTLEDALAGSGLSKANRAAYERRLGLYRRGEPYQL